MRALLGALPGREDLATGQIGATPHGQIDGILVVAGIGPHRLVLDAEGFLVEHRVTPSCGRPCAPWRPCRTPARSPARPRRGGRRGAWRMAWRARPCRPPWRARPWA